MAIISDIETYSHKFISLKIPISRSKGIVQSQNRDLELWRSLSTINQIDNYNVPSCGRGKELYFKIVIINRPKVGLQFFSTAWDSVTSLIWHELLMPVQNQLVLARDLFWWLNFSIKIYYYIYDMRRISRELLIQIFPYRRTSHRTKNLWKWCFQLRLIVSKILDSQGDTTLPYHISSKVHNEHLLFLLAMGKFSKKFPLSNFFFLFSKI